jgi:HEAT repeat protein
MAHARAPRKAHAAPAVARMGRMALFRTSKPNVKTLARRGDAAALVAAAGFQDLIPAAGGGMLDRGAEIRRDAILALGQLGPGNGEDAVEAALSDPSDAVRAAAIRVLFAREEAMPLAVALGWLPVDHGQSRSLAIKALLELRQPDCAPSLTVALVRAPGDAPIGDDEAALLRLLLDAGKGSEAAGEVVEELLVALADERDPVAERAEELLVLIAPFGTDDVIAELMAGAVPARAAAVLGQVKDMRALQPLMDGLHHRDAHVRAQCAAALGELRDPAAVEALIHASRDPEHRVRAQAGWALDRLGMVALVVGVSTMIRPIIYEAMSAGEGRPALPGAGNGASGNGASENGDATGEAVPDTISPEELERLLAGTDEAGE